MTSLEDYLLHGDDTVLSHQFDIDTFLTGTQSDSLLSEFVLPSALEQPQQETSHINPAAPIPNEVVKSKTVQAQEDANWAEALQALVPNVDRKPSMTSTARAPFNTPMSTPQLGHLTANMLDFSTPPALMPTVLPQRYISHPQENGLGPLPFALATTVPFQHPSFMQQLQMQHGHPAFTTKQMPNFAVQSATVLPMRKALSASEIESLFMAANNHPNLTRCKRDIAIIALLLDLHLSSGTMIKMTFNSIASILKTLNEPENVQQQHLIETHAPGSVDPQRQPCHAFTVWALRNWVQELIEGYGWQLDDGNQPLFVNSQPLYNSDNGEKSLRRIPLKRDAISKVLQSAKNRSGVVAHKNSIASSSLTPLNETYPQLINMLNANSRG